MTDLLPCPFCGKPPIVTEAGGICCENMECRAIVGVPNKHFVNGYEPSEAWNIRLAAQSAAPVGEELRRAIGRIIDPQAFKTILPASNVQALRKADAIIALIGLPQSHSGSPVGWGDDYPKDQS